MRGKVLVVAVLAVAAIGVVLLLVLVPSGVESGAEPEVLHASMGAMQGAGIRSAEAGFGAVGSASPDGIGIDPGVYLTTWNFSNLPPEDRSNYYRETQIAGGRLLREYWVVLQNREIEIAPGLVFPAWTYNGQVPGPTIRATVGDTVRIHFTNGGDRPHTMHFHGFHPAEMDGSAPRDFVPPGGTFVYEFEADPVGLHLYHCHVTPLTQHIHKGLYGVYLVDPVTPREPAQELVMMMNGFDTNFDEENEIYAVNSVAFQYMNRPIQVRLGELVRIYLVNILEFDQTNSFHVHANFFHEYRTGTGTVPNSYTDTVIMGQAERSVLELRFRHTGPIMFHAHKTEFSERGWMGMFDVLPSE
jgi:FtsP/CotA-like multicopper oxidase with cupredoxin domain